MRRITDTCLLRPEIHGRLSAGRHRTAKGSIMAKSQKKSNREVRKPKAEKVKGNASNPTAKTGIVPGLDNMKRK
jgi:hypothetical protein